MNWTGVRPPSPNPKMKCPKRNHRDKPKRHRMKDATTGHPVAGHAGLSAENLKPPPIDPKRIPTSLETTARITMTSSAQPSEKA